MVELRPLRYFRAETERRRWTLGLAIAPRCRQIDAVIVTSEASGLDCRFEPAAYASIAVPRAIQASYLRLFGRRTSSAGEAAVLAARLAEVEAGLIDEMATEAARVWDRVLSVGVLDFGLWSKADDGLVGFTNLCDSARLADLTGLNVVDAFASRDLAQDGAGTPLDSLPYWLVLRHLQKPRLMIEFDEETRVTFLPSAREASGEDQVLSWRLNRGVRWIERLSQAMRGCPAADERPEPTQLMELIELWRSTPLLVASSAAASEHRAQCSRAEHRTALALIKKNRWTASEVVTTAAEYLARGIASALTEHLPPQAKKPQWLMAGGGSVASLLRQKLSEALSEMSQAGPEELGYPAGLMPAIAGAALAQLNFDQTPANLTHLSGARIPRVLGRLTGGSPQNWQRLMRQMADQKPAVISLRAAM